MVKYLVPLCLVLMISSQPAQAFPFKKVIKVITAPIRVPFNYVKDVATEVAEAIILQRIL